MARGGSLTERRVAQTGVGHPMGHPWPKASWATLGHPSGNRPETRAAAGSWVAQSAVGHLGPPWFSGSGPNPQPLGLGHRATCGPNRWGRTVLYSTARSV